MDKVILSLSLITMGMGIRRMIKANEFEYRANAVSEMYCSTYCRRNIVQYVCITSLTVLWILFCSK